MSMLARDGHLTALGSGANNEGSSSTMCGRSNEAALPQWKAALAFLGPFPVIVFLLKFLPPVRLGHGIGRPRENVFATVVQDDNVAEVGEGQNPAFGFGVARSASLIGPDNHARRTGLGFQYDCLGPTDSLDALADWRTVSLNLALGDKVPEGRALALKLWMALQPHSFSTKGWPCSLGAKVPPED